MGGVGVYLAAWVVISVAIPAVIFAALGGRRGPEWECPDGGPARECETCRESREARRRRR